ncbi:MAG: hypothetical protein ACFFGZ_06085 [Candidatus Thorarchaeota archaeon]
MPDQEEAKKLRDELVEKMKDPSLAHVETQEAKSDVVLKLKCETCGKVSDFPVHCGTQMTFKEGKGLSCDSCGESQPMPEHCDMPMKPMIASA